MAYRSLDCYEIYASLSLNFGPEFGVVVHSSLRVCLSLKAMTSSTYVREEEPHGQSFTGAGETVFAIKLLLACKQ